jgi:hypothetical protein
MQILNRYEWLKEHASGWQFGEQGILRALCERFDITKGYEIGAGDGESLPVTLDFLDDLTLYEVDPDRQQKLKAKYPNATIYGCFQRPTPGVDGACVVVDVDSCDLEIAESIIEEYRPKILCVEHYDTEGPRVLERPQSQVPDWLIGVSLQGGFIIQQPWPVVNRSLCDVGYVMVAMTRVNGIYVYEGG